MPYRDPMPLICPAEHVTVDTGHLHSAVTAVHHAVLDEREPFRYQVVAAVNYLRPFLTIPRMLDQPTIEVEGEPLWWVVQAADEIGCTYGLSPIGTLFDAVDHLGRALAVQAPATDRGLAAVVEAETTLAFVEQRKDSPRD
ncbi:hypothetical protein [Nocardiopsis synnemataformans]|uniref:hypothetical protein n=1 Tax=Nocardiopsis synnemataformans TaxID=61305 RepID=UPI003EB76A49